MKPPRYPLQSALDLRATAKEQASRALADAVQALAAEERRLHEKEAERAALQEDRRARAGHLYDPEPGGTLSLPVIDRRKEDLAFLDLKIEEAARAIKAQKEAVKRAEARVESCRTRLVEADKELKAVEKHRENWLAEWQKEIERKEQRQTEEVVLARFVGEAQSDDRRE